MASLEQRERFRLALDAIQQAQLLADEACRALCSVDQPASDESAYSIACRLSDRIKEDWHRINNQGTNGND